MRIHIYCDDLSHAPKRIPITTFEKLPDGTWREDVRKNRMGRAGHVGTGVHLVRDTVPEVGWALDPEISNSDIRLKHELVCERTPTCRKRTARPRIGSLVRVLDRWLSTGQSEMALSVLAVTLVEQAKRKR